jgi:hypothetical protein
MLGEYTAQAEALSKVLRGQGASGLPSERLSLLLFAARRSYIYGVTA